VEDNVSVLFLGIDTSDERQYEEKSRTDAILVATFNKKEGTVKLLSIPRDTYTYVPSVGYDTKINHAHFHGGPKASMETVEDYLNIPIDDRKSTRLNSSHVSISYAVFCLNT